LGSYNNKVIYIAIHIGYGVGGGSCGTAFFATAYGN
jgi:hypothetical protein